MNSVGRLAFFVYLLFSIVSFKTHSAIIEQAVQVTRGPGSTIRVNFQTQKGNRYQVISSTDLIFWELASERVDGENDLVSIIYDTSGGAKRFFKLLVTPVPPPIPLTFKKAGSTFLEIIFPTQAAQQYHVYSSPNLLDWTIWGDLFVGNGNPMTARPDTAETSNLFFRVEPMQVIPARNMVRIPSGTFVMGSPLTELDRDLDEDPLTIVQFTYGFWMGKYEVTQREFENLMGTNPSWFRGDPDRPVEQVTWKEAMAYCARLTDSERAAGRLPLDYAYRLPTEAEFEYAARAGASTRFSFGDDPDYSMLGEYAWYMVNSNGRSHAVGQKKPNAYGLHDIYGNVWEWCFDWYSSHPGGTVKNPMGPSDGTARVFRGGGWDYKAAACRSAFRNYVVPVRRLDYLGFRVVLAPVL